MKDLDAIIFSLSTSEKQQFSTYLSQRNKRTDTKNRTLLKLISQGETNTETICKTLYGKINKNAYHALRKRLFDNLIDFIANKNLEDENSIDIQIIKYLLASRTFLLQKQYKTGYKLLDKAECVAEEHLLYPILNEIYHTKIQYASEYNKADIDTLIKKQNLNRKNHLLEDQLNSVYAKLKLVVNEINFNKKIVNFESVLNNIISDLNIDLNNSLSFKSLYQIVAIADISALMTTHYYKIESFVLNSYAILKANKQTNKQLYYQIEITYIIANTQFRNKKFDEALFYINEMHKLMLTNNKKYYKDFKYKFTLVKALSLNFNSEAKEAIKIVDNDIKHSDNSDAMLNLRLCLVMLYFQQEDYHKARHIVSKFHHTNKWYIEKVGIDWVIKKNLAELLLYIELREDDLFFSRLKSFKTNFNNYLKQINQERILVFLKFAEMHYKNPENSTTKKFRYKIENTFTWTKTSEEDIFVISFYSWLKSKIQKSPIYKTTLDLIHNY